MSINICPALRVGWHWKRPTWIRHDSYLQVTHYLLIIDNVTPHMHFTCFFYFTLKTTQFHAHFCKKELKSIFIVFYQPVLLLRNPATFIYILWIYSFLHLEVFVIFPLVNVFWNFMVTCIDFFSLFLKEGHSLGIQIIFTAWKFKFLKLFIWWFSPLFPPLFLKLWPFMLIL